MRNSIRQRYPLSRAWWISLTIALLGATASLGVSYYVELSREQSGVESNLKFWAPELADIFSHNDWLHLSKLGRTFVPPTAGSVIFRKGEQTVFSFPLETESSCPLAEHHVIQQYGASVGTLDICHEPIAILSRAITSPFFMITALSLFFVILFAAILPILSLRRGLTTLIDYLADWSRSTASSDFVMEPVAAGSKMDGLEAKLQALVQDFVQRRLELERKALRDEIVRDVAHNINSPIASLAVQIQRSVSLTANERTAFQERLEQMSGIVAKLKGAANCAKPAAVTHEKPFPSTLKLEMISPLLDAIVTDKREEKGELDSVRLHYEASSTSYGAFARIHALDFKVVLSNLLNNAFESIEDKGEITVVLRVTDSKVLILIRDTGRGIPEAVRGGLFREGFSHDKSSGSGRGLFHAKKTILGWNGEISLESRVGAGTQVLITLPLASPPSWFLPELNLANTRQIVVLDDDPSIHSLWNQRLPGVDLVSFSEPSKFEEWLASNPIETHGGEVKTLFLIDLRLGDGRPTGLDIIESNGLFENAVLVTSDAGQESIQKRCTFVGSRLLWKSEIEIVPILHSKLDKVTVDSNRTFAGSMAKSIQSRFPLTLPDFALISELTEHGSTTQERVER